LSIVKEEPLDKDEINRLNSIIHAKFVTADVTDDDDVSVVPVTSPEPSHLIRGQLSAALLATAGHQDTTPGSKTTTPRIRINLAGKTTSTSKPTSPEPAPPPPGLVNKELTVFPPVSTGNDVSNLCSIM
jgi:hypothetical protein